MSISICNECGMHFPNSRSYGGHKSGAHSKIGWRHYLCEGCNAVFLSKQALGGHTALAHPDRKQADLLKLRLRRRARARRKLRKSIAAHEQRGTALTAMHDPVFSNQFLQDFASMLEEAKDHETVPKVDISQPIASLDAAHDPDLEHQLLEHMASIIVQAKDHERVTKVDIPQAIAVLVPPEPQNQPYGMKIEQEPAPMVIISQVPSNVVLDAPKPMHEPHESLHDETPHKKKGSFGKAVLVAAVGTTAVVGGVLIAKKILDNNKQAQIAQSNPMLIEQQEPIKAMPLTKAHFGLTEDAGQETGVFKALPRTGLGAHIIS